MASINEADRQIISDLESAAERLGKAHQAIGRVIFGQDEVIEQVLIAILGGGHALLVGAPASPRPSLPPRWAGCWASMKSACSSPPT